MGSSLLPSIKEAPWELIATSTNLELVNDNESKGTVL